MKKIVILCLLFVNAFSVEKTGDEKLKNKLEKEFFVRDFSIASGYRRDRLNQFGKIEGLLPSTLYQTNRLNIWQNKFRLNFTFPDIIKIGVDVGAGYIADGKVILDRIYHGYSDTLNIHKRSYHGSHTSDIIPPDFRGFLRQ